MWEQISSVSDITNHRSIQQTTRTFAFDRRTGQLVDCCGANVSRNASIRQTGVLGGRALLRLQKQTYQVFNTTLNRPLPFVYAGTATVDGIQTYEFVEDVPATQFTTEQVPGSMIGSKTAVIRAPLFDQEHVINYVDPETGALLNVNEHLSIRPPNNLVTCAQALVLCRRGPDRDPGQPSARSSHSTAAGGTSSPWSRPPLPLIAADVGGVGAARGRLPRLPRAQAAR